MIIREYRSKDRQAWDEYALNHPHGVPYHLTAWKDAVENAYDFKGCYLIAETGKGGRIKGFLPLIHHHLPFSKGALIFLPFCDAAGPLADSEETEKALLDSASEQGIKKISVRCTRPFADIDKNHTINKNKVRKLLNLPDTSEALLASFKAKLRSQNAPDLQI